jgi:hypothetical protein
MRISTLVVRREAPRNPKPTALGADDFGIPLWRNPTNRLRFNISSDERQLEELIIDDMVAQKMENPPLVV